MYNTNWIDRPGGSQREPSPEETALRETFLAAQKTAYSLMCASNQLAGIESPDVNDCAALIRTAVHKPEKERSNAVKAAQLAVIQRQANYISTLTYFLEHAETWQSLRPTLVAQLEALTLSKEEPKTHFSTTEYVDIFLCLNCEAVVGLIDGCDIAINDARKRHYSRPTEKHAEAGFQQVFDALVAEVSDQFWSANARLAVKSRHSYDILRDQQVDKISHTSVPAEYVKCAALDAARHDFECAFNWNMTKACRDFNEETRGTFNDTRMSETLLKTTDVSTMVHLEEQRDAKLRTYGRSWRLIRNRLDRCQVLFTKVAELLPEALAEAASIQDEKLRRRAQNLCLFAARRLKENLKYVRESDRFVGEYHQNDGDFSAALGRSHKDLVQRIKSKELQRPSTRCTEEPYYG